MERVFPKPLVSGGHIRVVALSTSLGIVNESVRREAQTQLEAHGFHVSFAEHALDVDTLRSASIEHRVADLHAALDDPDVDMILAARGGFNVNQLLPFIDFEKVRSARKPICGHSDITALVNAVWARSGLVAYLGPNFSTLGMKQGAEYTWEAFTQSLSQPASQTLAVSHFWSDDKWKEDQDNRTFELNEGPWVLQEGEATGTLIGGNLCTLNLLQGTPYMPSLKGAVLFIEDDALTGSFTINEFDRNLESLFQLPGADEVCGLVLGRFQKSSEVRRELLRDVIATKRVLKNLPVIANIDFGHTSPQATLPIGATAFIQGSSATIEMRQR